MIARILRNIASYQESVKISYVALRFASKIKICPFITGTGILLTGDYRHQNLDHQDGNFLFNFAMSVPLPGLTLHFQFAMNGSIPCNH
jgi:hypothetical protein